MATEFERIARLAKLFGQAPRGVELGIGDDAAVLRPEAVCADGGLLVWTVDSCVDGIHFRRDIASFEDIGWRSFMAAASDVAAMAASPIGALSALMLPDDVHEEELDALARGQHLAATRVGTAVIGGNLSRAGELSITTTLVGRASRTVPRSGARVGDVMVLAGEVGLAGAGLRVLLRDGARWRADDADEVVAVTAWRRPLALIEDGLKLGADASAMADISDGLAQDAGHIAEASGVRIELEPDAFVSDVLRRVAARLGGDALQLALHGGEDYGLLATMDAGRVPKGARVIGRCVRGAGVVLSGMDEPLVLRGHDHFR